MIKLYFNPFSRASRVRWTLEELAVPYELVHMDFEKDDMEKPEFLKLHPHGMVPVLTDGDVTIFESAAICMYLADKFTEKKLVPPIGDLATRARYYQWMFYTMTELEPQVLEIFLQGKHYPPEKKNALIETDARAAYAERAQYLSQHLSKNPYMLGKEFSVADILVGGTLRWGSMGGLIDGYPVLKNYIEELAKRPAFIRAFKN